jgi:hypothetical protein
MDNVRLRAIEVLVQQLHSNNGASRKPARQMLQAMGFNDTEIRAAEACRLYSFEVAKRLDEGYWK